MQPPSEPPPSEPPPPSQNGGRCSLTAPLAMMAEGSLNGTFMRGSWVGPLLRLVALSARPTPERLARVGDPGVGLADR